MFKSHIQQYRSKLCISREKTTFKCKFTPDICNEWELQDTSDNLKPVALCQDASLDGAEEQFNSVLWFHCQT